MGLAIVLKLRDHKGQRVFPLHVLIFQYGRLAVRYLSIWFSYSYNSKSYSLPLYVGSALPSSSDANAAVIHFYAASDRLLVLQQTTPPLTNTQAKGLMSFYEASNRF